MLCEQLSTPSKNTKCVDRFHFIFYILQASCRAHGAELVIVESQGENDFIAGEVKRLKGT
jgi:predicted site-specific integrase-resolvase